MLVSGPAIVRNLPQDWIDEFKVDHIRVVRGEGYITPNWHDASPGAINLLYPSCINRSGDLCDIWVDDDGYVIYIVNRQARGMRPVVYNEFDDEQVSRFQRIYDEGLYPLKKH